MKKPIAPKVPNEPSRPALKYIYKELKIVISDINSKINIKFVDMHNFIHWTSNDTMRYIRNIFFIKSDLTSFDKNIIMNNIKKIDGLINAIKKQLLLEYPDAQIIKLVLTPSAYIRFRCNDEKINDLNLTNYNLALEQYNKKLNEYNVLNDKYLLELDKYNLFIKRQKYDELANEIAELKLKLNDNDIRDDIRRSF